jgi:hypothetical protein
MIATGRPLSRRVLIQSGGGRKLFAATTMASGDRTRLCINDFNPRGEYSTMTESRANDV